MNPSNVVIDEYDQKMADAAANFAGYCLMHVHRGVLMCGDKSIIFGNDGYKTDDERARREVELVRGKLRQYDVNVPICGLYDDGHSWALVVENHERLPIDQKVLNRMVWDAWLQATEERKQARQD